MNWRRYFLALSVTAILTLVVDVLLNAVIFRDVYKASASFLLPADQLNARVPLGWAALLILVAVYGLLFVHSSWHGVSGGIRFGALLATAGVAGIAGIASVSAWPTDLLVVAAVQQVVNALLLGILFGWLYRHGSTSEVRSQPQ